jgi:hypothetical protein
MDCRDDDRRALDALNRAIEAYRESAVLCDLAAIAKASSGEDLQALELQHDLQFPLGTVLKAI